MTQNRSLKFLSNPGQENSNLVRSPSDRAVMSFALLVTLKMTLGLSSHGLSASARGLDNTKPLIVDRKRKVENDIGSAARMLYDVNSGTSSTQIDRMMAAMIATGDQVTNRSFLYVCLRH